MTHNITFLNTFIVDFLLLFVVTYLVRQRYLRDVYSSTSAGGIIMAVGIFAWSALQYFPANFPRVSPYLALECLILWLFIAQSYTQCYMERHFYVHMRDVLNRFNIGTWCTSTALLALLWLFVFPDLEEIAWILTLIAVPLWIEYMRIAVDGLRMISKGHLNLKVTGNIFLSVVSIQAIILLLINVMESWFPWQIGLLLMTMGFIFYLYCFGLVIRSFFQLGWRHSISDWSANNTLIYGALAISGIAAVQMAIIPQNFLIGIWLTAAVLFMCTESVAILHLMQRIYQRGFLQAIWSYDVAQWMRIFSYGAMYAFSISLPLIPLAFVATVMQYVLAYGQYLIFGLLFIEIAIFFQCKYKPRPIKSTLRLQEREDQRP